jgi:hypothetical protein
MKRTIFYILLFLPIITNARLKKIKNDPTDTISWFQQMQIGDTLDMFEILYDKRDIDARVFNENPSTLMQRKLGNTQAKYSGYYTVNHLPLAELNRFVKVDTNVFINYHYMRDPIYLWPIEIMNLELNTKSFIIPNVSFIIIDDSLQIDNGKYVEQITKKYILNDYLKKYNSIIDTVKTDSISVEESYLLSFIHQDPVEIGPIYKKYGYIEKKKNVEYKNKDDKREYEYLLGKRFFLQVTNFKLLQSRYEKSTINYFRELLDSVKNIETEPFIKSINDLANGFNSYHSRKNRQKEGVRYPWKNMAYLRRGNDSLINYQEIYKSVYVFKNYGEPFFDFFYFNILGQHFIHDLIEDYYWKPAEMIEKWPKSEIKKIICYYISTNIKDAIDNESLIYKTKNKRPENYYDGMHYVFKLRVNGIKKIKYNSTLERTISRSSTGASYHKHTYIYLHEDESKRMIKKIYKDVVY